MPSIAIAIMCKAPAPGVSKTRLSPPLRPEECAALSACFIADLGRVIARLAHPAVRRFALYTPQGAEAPLRRLLPGFTLTPQAEGGLGERIIAGFDDLLAGGHDGAILVGADSPTLPAAILEGALHALLGGAPMVVSPALDGGYTLIGLTRRQPGLFQDISWSTALVFEQTQQRAQAIGCPATVLEMWYDVDDAAAYAMLEAELSGKAPPFARPGLSAPDAPATRRFLALRAAAVKGTPLAATR